MTRPTRGGVVRRAMAPGRVFVGVALGLLVLWAAAHGAGWVESTSVLSGTAVRPDTMQAGLTYTALWLALWIAAPILLLAALVQRGLEACTGGGGE